MADCIWVQFYDTNFMDIKFSVAWQLTLLNKKFAKSIFTRKKANKPLICIKFI